VNAIESILVRLNQTLTRYARLLEEEALALRDADRLAALLPRREEIHHELAEQWRELAQQAGGMPPAGLADLRQRLEAQSPSSPAWQELVELAHTTDRLNRVNARLIEEQMRRTQAALQVLRHSLSSREVYGADGRLADFLRTHRRIDSA